MDDTPASDSSHDAGPGAEHSRCELRVLGAIRRIIRGIDLYSRRLQTEAGVTTPQLVCLTTVVASGPITISQLGRDVHLSASTIVGIVDRLESRGFVERARGHADRRIVKVSATREGRNLVDRAPSLLQDRLATGLGALDPSEQAAIAAAFERVVALMELESVAAAPILETGALPEPPST